jgi:hypothetical protein
MMLSVSHNPVRDQEWMRLYRRFPRDREDLV